MTTPTTSSPAPVAVAPATPDEETVNIVIGRTSWSEVCRLSRAMTNGLGSHAEDHVTGGPLPYNLVWPRLDLVWMADDSIERGWGVFGVAADTQNSFNVQYHGFAEEKSAWFTWGSATSSAEIQATREADGKWEVVFTGVGPAETGRESGYAAKFMGIAFTEIVKVSMPRKTEFHRAVHPDDDAGN